MSGVNTQAVLGGKCESSVLLTDWDLILERHHVPSVYQACVHEYKVCTHTHTHTHTHIYWGEPERAPPSRLMAAHMRPYKRICTQTYVHTYINSAQNPRSLLRCRASRWAVDCAAHRALSLTLRLADRMYVRTSAYIYVCTAAYAQP